jgi:hypothetical protein
MRNLGMEKRPRRFSLPEAFFEGNRTGGREDCLSTRQSYGEETEMERTSSSVDIWNAEFRSAEKNAEGTASKT